MLFLSRHCSSLPDERFVFSRFHASSADDNRSPFQLSLVHAIFPKKNVSLFERQRKRYRDDKHFLTKCPSLMDGPDAKRFLR